MSHSRGPSDCKVYVGDLGSNASQTELEDAFSYYGPLKNVWVARNPPGFAFVEFEDPRDARDSVRGLDGRTVCNRRITVEMSTGRTRNRGGSWRPTVGSGRYGRGWDPADRCYDCGESGHYSYDCRNKRPIRRSFSRSRSRDRRSRSRTPTKRSRRSPSRSYSRSRSRDRSRSRTPKRAASRSPRRSSRSPRRNGSSRSPTSRRRD
ncbi:serine/arginine-rich splicing factor 3-like isoform X1 [Amphibalanus amphitrite]|uniref:serine/arginine-rich splicing factor 3-like isoform X1 n=1 Tax=Amphibalanus amphitrite TaxID=1232801 RepID=UPI001C914D7E|nr:serine/arginine-rich splicing factor 3-like isoform X1 [Amphibalanus amphitrite]XP_043237241.1 serine/arginine-rich splicing factor 3-like isoform X1 [Amphibalanus amphitrite]